MEEEQVTPAPESPEPANQELSSMNKLLLPLFIILLLVIGAGAFFIGSQKARQTPTPSPTPLMSPEATAEPSPTGSPTATPKATKTPTPTPTATPFQALGVTAAVAPTSSVACSPTQTTFNFSATITTNATGTVTYKWERSDGAIASEKTEVFSEAGSKTVSTTWTITRTSGQTYNGWQRVKILFPNSITSNEANFTVSCP